MSPQIPPADVNPPRWAESLLSALLPPANRATITGDLLEEYREVVWPSRGPVGAYCWYLKHALSLVVLSHTAGQWAVWLAAAGTLVTAFVMRDRLDPPFPTAAWTALAIAGSAGLSLRSSDLPYLWRASVAFGVMYGATALTASVLAILLLPPPDPSVVRLLYEGSRGQVVVACCLAIFAAAGFRGALRGRRVGTGIVVAMGTGVVGAVTWMGLVASMARFAPDLLQQIGSLSAFQVGPISSLVWPGEPFSGSYLVTHAIRYVLMLVILSIVPGLIGATAGRAFGGVLDRRVRSAPQGC